MTNYKVSHIPNKPGIYIWLNKENNKFYLGSSINLYQRRSTHLKEMRRGRNACGMLQAAYNKYGEEFLDFKVLLVCEVFELLRYEQELLDKLKPAYNKRLVAYSNLGLKMSDETKKKHRIRGKSRYPIEMINAARANNYFRGKCVSDETKEKNRLASLGRKKSPEDIRKQSEAQMGIVRTFKTLKGKLISPYGQVFENISNFRKFSRAHNIDYRRISDFFTGRRTSYKGWTFTEEGI